MCCMRCILPQNPAAKTWENLWKISLWNGASKSCFVFIATFIGRFWLVHLKFRFGFHLCCEITLQIMRQNPATKSCYKSCCCENVGEFFKNPTAKWHCPILTCKHGMIFGTIQPMPTHSVRFCCWLANFLTVLVNAKWQAQICHWRNAASNPCQVCVSPTQVPSHSRLLRRGSLRDAHVWQTVPAHGTKFITKSATLTFWNLLFSWNFVQWTVSVIDELFLN